MRQTGCATRSIYSGADRARTTSVTRSPIEAQRTVALAAAGSTRRRIGFELRRLQAHANTAFLFNSRLFMLTALLQQLGDKTGPPGLMACADSGAGVAVEVLIEKHEVIPVRIVSVDGIRSMHGPRAVVALHSASDAPNSSRRTASSLNSFVNFRRDNPMTQFSI